MYLSSGIQHDVIVTWPTYCNVQQGFPLLSSEHLSEGAGSLVPYVQGVLPMWTCNNELPITRKCTLLPLCSGERGRGDRTRKYEFIFCMCMCLCVCCIVQDCSCVACVCMCAHVLMSVVLSWKEGNEKEVFLSLHVCTYMCAWFVHTCMGWGHD